MKTLAPKMTALDEEMDAIAGEMILTGEDAAAFHGFELLGAAEMLRNWAGQELVTIKQKGAAP